MLRARSVCAIQVAVSPNGPSVHIYAAPDLLQPWRKVASLDKHIDRVTDLDWHASGRIITCSVDRECYIWTEQEGNWTSVRVCA